MSTDLAVITEGALVSFDQERVNDYLKKLREQETSVIADISTEAGRDDIRSRAFKLAKTKTAIDKKGAELKEEAQATVKAVDAERRRIWDELEALQLEVRKPLTEWEQAEKNRVAEHESAIIMIEAALQINADATAKALQGMIDSVQGMANREWEEFTFRATATIKRVVDDLSARLTVRKKADEDAAELERLRQLEIKRQNDEREAQIREEESWNELAAIANAWQATQYSELSHIAAAFIDALVAEEQAVEKLEQEKARALEAELNELAAIALLFDRNIQAGIDSKAAADAAAQKVIDDAAADKKRLDDEEIERGKNTAHKKKINNAALNKILSILNSEEDIDDAAKAVITAIAKGEVPHVSIKY